MKLAPSKNPEQESKTFSILSLAMSVLSLFVLWFLAIAGIAFGVRGAIFSHRVHNRLRMIMSVAGVVVGIVSMVLNYSQQI